MACRSCAALIVAGVLVATACPATAAAPPAVVAPAAVPPAAAPPVEATPTPDSALGTAAAQPAAAPVDLGEELPRPRPTDLSYGVAARLVWVSVPSWMLNLFTKNNVPLSSWGTGVSLFRRKGNFEIALSFNYQNMSPPDGNWLGSSGNAAVDTNFVHFQDFALYGMDVSFLWHAYLTDWFGLHYGAGLGLGIIGGHIIRTYDRNNRCTDATAGDVSQCAPGPGDHPFTSGSVPGAVPILNAQVGVDFRLPQVRGWEARLEGGFYDAFFLGGGVGYTF